MPKRISSQVLFYQFPFQVIKHFVLSTILTGVRNILNKTILNIWQNKGAINNYATLLPTQLSGWGHWITKERFVLIGLLLVIIFSTIYYFDDLTEGELGIKGGHYSKRVLLEKFRRLPLQEKGRQAEKIINLVENDTATIGEYWEHLYNHSYHSILDIILIIYFSQKELFSLGGKRTIFFFSWFVLLGAVAYFFNRIIFRKELTYKKKLTTERALRNKEINKSILIESMGLTSKFRSQHEKIIRQHEKWLFGFNRTKSFSRSLSYKLLLEAFPFLLLLFNSGSFDGLILGAFWQILNALANIFYCFRDYADYASSQERINNFLALPEKKW